MNCETVKEQLFDYCTGELSEQDAADVEGHLEICAECRKELELCREMQEMLCALPDEELPEGYHAELMQKLEKEAKTAEAEKTEWAVIPFREKLAEKQKKQKEQKSRQKKQQRTFRQLGMMAAALVLVAATGPIQDMWEQQRQHRHDVIYESQNPAESAETEQMMDTAVMPIAEEAEQSRITAEPAAENTQPAQQRKEKREVSAGGITETAPMVDAEENHVAAQPMTAADVQGTPQTAAYIPEEAAPMMVREMPTEETEEAAEEAFEIVSLQVADEEMAKHAIRSQLAALNGWEEAAESGLTVLLPLENMAAFYDVLREWGALSWVQTNGTAAGAQYCRIEIQFVTE